MNTYLCEKGSPSGQCPHCCLRIWDCCPVWGRALRECVRNVQGVCAKNGKTMQEPDYSVAFTVELANWLSANLPSTWLGNVSVGGCYVHQSPWVSHFDSTNHSVYCEAGDVLLICRKSDQNCERYNSALLQLKMETGSVYQVLKGSYDMKSRDITIIHLSDLHFDIGREMTYVDALLSDIKQQIRHVKDSCNSDIVFVQF